MIENKIQILRHASLSFVHNKIMIVHPRVLRRKKRCSSVRCRIEENTFEFEFFRQDIESILIIKLFIFNSRKTMSFILMNAIPHRSQQRLNVVIFGYIVVIRIKKITTKY